MDTGADRRRSAQPGPPDTAGWRLNGRLAPRRTAGLLLAGGVAVLSACGGGGPAEGAATAARAALAAPAPVAAAATAPLTAGDLFDWAERAYPQLFPGHQVERVASGYSYRYYAATDNYLGTDGARALITGALTQGVLTDLGPMAGFACQVQPLACAAQQPLHARLQRVAAGPGFSLGINAQGAGMGWGDGLPASATVAQPGTVARAVTGLNGVASVVAGPGFTLAVTREGRVQFIHQGWGSSTSPTAAQPVTWAAPVTLPHFDQVVSVGVCANVTELRVFALRRDGTVWSVHAGFNGVEARASQVTGLPAVRQLGQGADQVQSQATTPLKDCGLRALDADGLPWRLFGNTVRSQPVATAARDPLVQEPLIDISCSSALDRGHCLGATPDGRVLAWGFNRSGQAGLDPAGASTVTAPRPVAGAAGVRRVWAVGEASYALRSDGTLLAWGQHQGPAVSAGRPWQPLAQFDGQGPVDDLAAHQHLLVLMKDGSVRTSSRVETSALGGPPVPGSSAGVQPAGVDLGSADAVAMPPVALVQAGPAGLLEGDTLAVQGGASRDANGDALTHRWALLDRPEGSTATLSDPAAAAPTLRADQAGTYRVQLVVNDGRFDSQPTVASVVVVKAAAPQPVYLTLNPTVQAVLLQRNCLACHAIDKKLVGPSFNDIATRYAADLQTSQGRLRMSSRIRFGSVDTWGPVPMPGSQAITLAEVESVLDWLSRPAPKK